LSANAEDEAKARLEVAQLYEEMGQGAKAVRYLIAAAEIYRDRGDQARMREVYQRVLAIEPNNAQATKDLGALQQAAIDAQARPSAGGTPPAAPPGVGARVPPSPTSGGPGAAATPPGAPPAGVQAGAAGAGPSGRRVMVPTPWVGRDPKFLAAVRAQVTGPPDKSIFPYNPLPRIDDRALQAKAEARREKEAQEARKNQTRVDSQFSSGESRFSFGGAKQQQPAGTFGQAASVPSTGSQPAAQAPAASRFAPAGDIKGGNRDLAEMIRKRMEGKG